MFGALAAGIAACLSSAPQIALAQANRTFVSGQGSDTNNCSLSAPCRSFQHAHDVTTAGGEITVLDPAGYGPITISKAIALINDGVGEAGITTAAATDAIDINTANGDTVTLRGLTLVGQGVGVNGIVFNAGGSVLSIENCVIRGFARDGIDFYGAAGQNQTVDLTIANTVVSNNGAAQGGTGIVVVPTGAGLAAVHLNRAAAIGNAVLGVLIEGGTGTGSVVAEINDSAAVGNQYGIQAQSTVGFPQRMSTTVIVNASQVANNSVVGLRAVGGEATLMFGLSAVGGNATGWEADSSGVVQSFGDNYVNANSNDGGNPPVIVRH
jgi:hypothetical protein